MPQNVLRRHGSMPMLNRPYRYLQKYFRTHYTFFDFGITLGNDTWGLLSLEDLGSYALRLRLMGWEVTVTRQSTIILDLLYKYIVGSNNFLNLNKSFYGWLKCQLQLLRKFISSVSKSLNLKIHEKVWHLDSS